MIKSFKNKETEKVYSREGSDKLPRDIQDKIWNENVRFIVAEGEEGFYFQEYCPPRSEEEYQHFIFLSLKPDKSEEFQQNTIAHELAHFILKHGQGGSEVEKAADDLAGEWGFGRSYESY